MSDIESRSQGQAAPADFVALAAGQTIGRYEIVSILGQGGFGITYRASDAQLGREVAIKEYLPLALAVRQGGTTVLPRSTDAAEDFSWGRDRFVAEGRTLATLQRAPAIVRVYDFLEANGTAYIVMELLHGQTLERRLKEGGPLSPAELDRMLWPLLDGLQQVHGAGFLHRDIKPANILLDEQGNPTLIDFGASRAAVAGRTAAMTAIFTPGYAAAEQMTSAKQGPWTDIYGLAATFYHAITGTPPASAFDRMLDDDYQRLTTKAPAGFASSLLAGLDAGLALRAGDRPQSIAGWRQALDHIGSLQGDATVVMGRPSTPVATVAAQSPPRPKRRGAALWIGAAAAAVVALGGGYFALLDDRRASSAAVEKVAQETQAAQEAQRQKDQAELARLREQVAVREKAEQDAAQRRQIEEETRQKIAAEMAEQKRRDDEARQKVETDATAQRKAEEDGRKIAEAAEAVLRLTLLDRQHVQIALTALGYATNGSDGTFGARTREMIAAWQKGRNDPSTGFLSGAQNQALLKEAAPAVSRFDEEQKKLEDARKKADEEKARAEAAARVAPPPPAVAAPRPVMPNTAAAAIPQSGPDGVWQGVMHCTPGRNGGEFSVRVTMTVAGGSGTWIRPGTGEGGIHSISLTFNGSQVVVSRIYEPANRAGIKQTATLRAQYDGRDTVTGSGSEANGGGRICDISAKRVR